MTEREQVIRGLECCKQWSDAGIYDGYLPEICENCPRAGLHADAQECHEALLNDALALLQAQEPRVMTLEEALGGEECWVEYPNGCCGYADCYLSYATNGANIYRTMQRDFNVPLAKYGRTWRCWTSRPTDEQREVIPWS